jgi:hypothetical protein
MREAGAEQYETLPKVIMVWQGIIMAYCNMQGLDCDTCMGLCGERECGAACRSRFCVFVTSNVQGIISVSGAIGKVS